MRLQCDFFLSIADFGVAPVVIAIVNVMLRRFLEICTCRRMQGMPIHNRALCSLKKVYSICPS